MDSIQWGAICNQSTRHTETDISKHQTQQMGALFINFRPAKAARPFKFFLQEATDLF